ncbi:MAG: alpha-2-macroglobulin family protein, partial [Flavitalea sp.]
ITTKKTAGASLEEPQSLTNTIRRNFRDHAFWQPRLFTDKNGSATFTANFPDDITNWKTSVYAINTKKQTGYISGNIRSFKTFTGVIGLPNFLTEGDEVNIIGKTQNYLGDSITVYRTFLKGDDTISRARFGLKTAKIDTFTQVAGTTDSVKYGYIVQADNGFTDGEIRSIPVIKKGTLETKGIFAVLDRDTTITISADSASGPLTIRAELSAMPIVLDELETIRTYEYDCNEQMASKMKALLYQERVCKLLNREFKGGGQIKEIIAKLSKSKNKSLLWGWWTNGETVQWISLHVIEALLMAEKEGYKINLNKQHITDKVLYLMNNYNYAEKVSALKVLENLGARINYTSYLDTLKKSYGKLNEANQLQLLEIMQKHGYMINTDSIVKKASRTMFGNMFWGNEHPGYIVYDNTLLRTATIYNILKNQGGYIDVLKKIRLFFFEQRKSGSWRNTYESIRVLDAILPELMKEELSSAPAKISIQHMNNTTVSVFPFDTTFNATSPVKIYKPAGASLYLTGYRKFWNNAPAKVESDFIVSSWFEDSGDTVTTLKGGKAVKLKVKVKVLANAEYVHIEIPIPAGCSYERKAQGSWYNEVHREHFKNKVSIFSTKLSTGEYIFEVSLMPRYTGKFTLNPAKVEMMYFPVFFGREVMKRVSIH